MLIRNSETRWKRPQTTEEEVLRGSLSSTTEERLPPRIELRKMYPPSLRLIIKHVLPWIFMLGGICFFYWWFKSSEDPFPHAGLLKKDMHMEFNIIVYLSLIILLAKALYSALYTCSYDYFVERGCLVIRKGVTLRHTGTYRLAHITDIYLVRNIFDLLLGLHTLKVGTAADRSELFADIEGLSSSTSQALQKHLLELVDAKNTH